MWLSCDLFYQDAQASFDVNGHDPDPQPRYDYTNENRWVTTAPEVIALAVVGRRVAEKVGRTKCAAATNSKHV